MRRRFLSFTILLIFATLVLSSVPAATKSILTVKIHPVASLAESGESVTVTVMVSCEEGLTVLEAFVYVVQGDNQSQFAPLGIVCDGKRARYTVSVASTTSTAFVTGKALASTYVLLYDPLSGETFSEGPSRTIRIR